MTMRKSVAIVCVAAILLAALIPAAAAPVTAPLVQIGTVSLTGAESAPEWIQDNFSHQPALTALILSHHIPRASLLPARS